jgi:hypothetical protein
VAASNLGLLHFFLVGGTGGWSDSVKRDNPNDFSFIRISLCHEIDFNDLSPFFVFSMTHEFLPVLMC